MNKIRYLLLLTVLVIAISSLFVISASAESLSDYPLRSPDVELDPCVYVFYEKVSPYAGTIDFTNHYFDFCFVAYVEGEIRDLDGIHIKSSGIWYCDGNNEYLAATYSTEEGVYVFERDTRTIYVVQPAIFSSISAVFLHFSSESTVNLYALFLNCLSCKSQIFYGAPSGYYFTDFLYSEFNFRGDFSLDDNVVCYLGNPLFYSDMTHVWSDDLALGGFYYTCDLCCDDSGDSGDTGASDFVYLYPGYYKWMENINNDIFDGTEVTIPEGYIYSNGYNVSSIKFLYDLKPPSLIPHMIYDFYDYNQSVNVYSWDSWYKEYIYLTVVEPVELPALAVAFLIPVSDVPDPEVPPIDPKPEDPDPEDPGESEVSDKTFYVKDMLNVGNTSYLIPNKTVDFIRYDISGENAVFTFTYTDFSTVDVTVPIPEHYGYEFSHFRISSSDNVYKSEELYPGIHYTYDIDDLDTLSIHYEKDLYVCDLYFEGRGLTSIKYPRHDVVSIAIERSYSDSYNNFNVYLMFNDGVVTFFEFEHSLPKVEGKSFAGFYLYDPENGENIGDYIPCDGEFHEINQKGDFSLNTCFIDYKKDFSVNFMNWSGTFTLYNFVFNTDLDYLVIDKLDRGISVTHYTPGENGDFVVSSSEFFNIDTYVGIQSNPNSVDSFLTCPIYVSISNEDVLFYLAPVDYEYLYDLYIGKNQTEENSGLLDSISDALDSLELPNASEFSVMLDSVFDNNGFYRYMRIFKNILEFDLFTTMLIISFLMAMAGYILHGKRG